MRAVVVGLFAPSWKHNLVDLLVLLFMEEAISFRLGALSGVMWNVTRKMDL